MSNYFSRNFLRDGERLLNVIIVVIRLAIIVQNVPVNSINFITEKSIEFIDNSTVP